MKNNKGFSLVELIVVIAIMAILAAVAVVGFSVYIPKAQQANDKQLVSDVTQAFDLYYQGNMNEMTGGYVIITLDGITAGGCATEAMNDVFGEGNWEDLKLAYDGWEEGEGDLKLITSYDYATLQQIGGSSFVNSSTEGMLNAVTGMTGIMSDVIADRIQNDPDKAETYLNAIFGQGNDVVVKLEELEIESDDYPTAISNLLVGTMADSIGSSPAMQTMVNMYAAAYTYAEETGDDAALLKMQQNLENVSLDAFTPADGEFATEEDRKNAEIQKGWDVIMAGIEVEEGDTNSPYAGFAAHMNDNADQIEKDNEALGSMMGAVKDIAGDFQDKESLINPNLFSESEVANQVNDYLGAVKAVAGLNSTDLQELKNNLQNYYNAENDVYTDVVVVFVAADGSISVVPGVN